MSEISHRRKNSLEVRGSGTTGAPVLNHAVVVLCAGEINYRDLPIGTNHSSASIPVSGKPVISWVLDDLIERGLREIVVVIRREDGRLRSLIDRTHAKRGHISIVAVEKGGSINDSLRAGLQRVSSLENLPSGVSVVFGDTLIQDKLSFDLDCVCVKQVEDARRWCLVELDSDGSVVGFIDKPEAVIHGQHWAAAGHYCFKDVERLFDAVETAVRFNETEISAALSRYMEERTLQSVRVEEWLDFGHIDRLAEARRKLLRPRYFNDLVVDPVLGTISKTSDHSEKLQNEIDWYSAIPDELKVLTPRIISQRAEDGRVRVVQEYYGYPTLSELYVYGDLHPERWQSILKYLFRIHDCFRKNESILDKADVESMYWAKTFDRLEELKKQSPPWWQWFDRDTIIHNGIELKGISLLSDGLKNAIGRLIETRCGGVIHGDFCFSNILFDLNSQIIRLIDPRGSFGKKGVFGDTRYDVGKLRHSVCGFYDFIIADLFSIEFSGGEIKSEIFDVDRLRPISLAFDSLVTSAGYCSEEIKLIEGLLFLSMPPLHRDYPDRQIMMMLRGLEILNELNLCESLST